MSSHFNCTYILFWFSGFRGEESNVIFYQNMPNLHIRYKSAERKIAQKNSDYMLTTPSHVVQLTFELILTYTKAAMDN
jgi:hypothetical protein